MGHVKKSKELWTKQREVVYMSIWTSARSEPQLLGREAKCSCCTSIWVVLKRLLNYYTNEVFILSQIDKTKFLLGILHTYILELSKVPLNFYRFPLWEDRVAPGPPTSPPIPVLIWTEVHFQITTLYPSFPFVGPKPSPRKFTEVQGHLSSLTCGRQAAFPLNPWEFSRPQSSLGHYLITDHQEQFQEQTGRSNESYTIKLCCQYLIKMLCPWN